MGTAVPKAPRSLGRKKGMPKETKKQTRAGFSLDKLKTMKTIRSLEIED